MGNEARRGKEEKGDEELNYTGLQLGASKDTRGSSGGRSKRSVIVTAKTQPGKKRKAILKIKKEVNWSRKRRRKKKKCFRAITAVSRWWKKKK